MSKFMVISGAIGIACTVASLIVFALTLVKENRWGMVVACLASLSTVLFLTLVGVEQADEFWNGR